MLRKEICDVAPSAREIFQEYFTVHIYILQILLYIQNNYSGGGVVVG